MIINNKIAVIGGDERLVYCAAAIGEKGFEAAIYGQTGGALPDKNAPVTRAATLTDALGKAKYALLGIPALPDGININTSGENRIPGDTLLSHMKADTVLIGGKIPELFRARAEKRGIKTVDYAENERLAVLNAVPTAEGAVAVAVNAMKKTLWKSRVLILGYGRVGSALAGRLCALGADVTVAARRPEQRALAECSGCQSADIYSLSPLAGGYDVIFNTVPALVLGEEELSRIRADAAVIDLASLPGGIDSAAAEKYGIGVIRALSLPGRTAPETAGRIIAAAVLDMIEAEHKGETMI